MTYLERVRMLSSECLWLNSGSSGTVFFLSKAMWRSTWFHWTPAGPVRSTVVPRWSHNATWVSTKASVYRSPLTPWRCAPCSCRSARWDLRLRRNSWWVWIKRCFMPLKRFILNGELWSSAPAGYSQAEPHGLRGKCRDGLPLAAGPNVERGGSTETRAEESEQPQKRQSGGWTTTSS